MAKSLSIKAGSKAEFIFTRAASPLASSVLFSRWQISLLPSALAGQPKSFFDKLATDVTLFPSDPAFVLARIPVNVGADFNILEVLATFAMQSNTSDGDVTGTFIVRDSVSGLLSTTLLSPSPFLYVAGSSVFRGPFAPGPHIFTLEVLASDGPILISGGSLGSTALYIQQMKA